MSSTVIRIRSPCLGLLDFLTNLFLKKNSEIWTKYRQWRHHFKFLEEIRIYWLFHVCFGETRFLKWHDVINSNSWFLAILKKFSGLPSCYLGSMVVNINALFAEWNTIKHDYFQILLLGILSGWNEPTIYFQI